MPRHRRVLIVAAVVLVAGVVASLVALDAVVGASLPKPVGAAQQGGASGITDCATTNPDWIAKWVTGQADPIRAKYGDTVVAHSAGWSTPAEFPVSAYAWAGTSPACGSTIVLSDGTVWSYRLDVKSATRRQFDAVSSMLTATGFLMTADVVPRAGLGDPGLTDATNGDADASAAGASSSDSPYREFEKPDGTAVWMTLYTDDLTGDDASGELLIGFQAAGVG